MKKLVTAACALVAASAFAVESANIVGYQELTTRTGASFELLGSTFIPVGSANLGATGTLLDAIKPGGTFTFGDDSIVVFENGYTQFEATYFGAAIAAEVGIDEGWWDISCLEDEQFPASRCYNAYVLPYGSAVAFKRGLSGSKLKVAGEVLQANFTAPAPYAFNLVPNTSPKDITLFDLKAAGTFTFGDDSIVVFEDGYTQFECTYFGAAIATEVGIDEGWWDIACLDDEQFPASRCYNAYVLPAGVSIAFKKGLSGSRLSIPNPIPEE